MQFNCEKLEVYTISRKLIVDVYKIANTFPDSEKYGLAAQIKRSVTSIALNIAEGSGKKSKKDFANFVRISIGSLIETDTSLKIAIDLQFITENAYKAVDKDIEKLYFKLIGLHKHLKKMTSSQNHLEQAKRCNEQSDATSKAMQQNPPRILFISRAYPPVTGGIENQNYELSAWLSKLTPTKTLANTRGRTFLPLFAPYALLKTLCTLHKYDVILLGDGVLAFIAWTVKLFSRKPVISVVHGLDINYDSASLGVWYEKFLIAIYQKLWVGIFLKKIDHFIAVGNETVRVGIAHGIPKEKITFIPNGVHPEKFIDESITRDDIFGIIGEEHRGKKILLTSGRLAKRKGVAWFIRNVLPQLDQDIVYIVSGDGPDKQNITDAIKETGAADRVILMGRVSDKERNTLFFGTDAFIQANITVPGDMEGFGLSVIEAGLNGPVIASHLEGLRDAIKDGENGFSIESENPETWKEKVTYVLSDDFDRAAFTQKSRNYIIENLSWAKISQKYLEVITSKL